MDKQCLASSQQIREEQLRIKRCVRREISIYVPNLEDLNDIEQDVYLKMCEKKDDYIEKGRLSQYARVFTRNAAIDFLRRKENRICSLEDLSSEICDTKDMYTARNHQLLDCLDQLLEKVHNVSPMSLDLKIFCDFIELHMTKTAIRLKEHVSMRRVNRVLDETRVYVLRKIDAEDDVSR